MAVATPVLERQTLQNQSAELSADEMHNSQIKENYKRLINPELNINEVRGRTVESEVTEQPVAERRESIVQPEISARQSILQPRRQVQPEQSAARTVIRPAQPYLVTNARADADIFRADSPVNQRRAYVEETSVASAAEEDESEDLRPTSTTIQYRTLSEERQAARAAEEREGHILGKRDKIIIATFISVVVALFVLVIVNSAVIAGLNGELSAIESGVAAASEMLSAVNSQIQAATSMENIAEYALSHGLILL